MKAVFFFMAGGGGWLAALCLLLLLLAAARESTAISPTAVKCVLTRRDEVSSPYLHGAVSPVARPFFPFAIQQRQQQEQQQQHQQQQ